MRNYHSSSEATKPGTVQHVEELRRRRVKAAWIDIGVVILIFLPFGFLAGDVDTGPNEYGIYLEGLLPVLFFLGAVLAYFGLTEGATGQSVGKRIQGLRVSGAEGGAASGPAIAIRTLGRIVDWLPVCFLLGYLSIRLSGERFQRLGDLVAKTTVTAVETRPSGPGRKALLGLVGICGVALAGAIATSDAGEKEDFIERADQICFEYEERANALERELNNAQRPSEAIGPLGEFAEVAAEGTRELGALNPPAAFEHEWREYIGVLNRYDELAQRGRARLAARDLEGYRQVQLEFGDLNADLAESLEGSEFQVCG